MEIRFNSIDERQFYYGCFSENQKLFRARYIETIQKTKSSIYPRTMPVQTMGFGWANGRE